ncbi:hypothetical protein HDU67_006086 [Dinochytrium kinnereticum]|nr:hypothetical protein HDU67_006086 [Dinochytrium kinnereticum]
MLATTTGSAGYDPYDLERILTDLLPLLTEHLRRGDGDDELPFPASSRPEEALPADVSGFSRAWADDGRPTIAPPSKLRAMFPGKLELPETGLERDAFWETVRVTLRESIRTSSPRFLDKLYAGTDAIGQISELLTAVLNTNVHVYSVSPVFTLMELSIIKRLSSLVGFIHATGVLQPGGSASNHLAMVTARTILYPEQRKQGAARSGKILTCFTSDHAHYSIEKAAMAMGLGLDGVIKVPVTMDGRILPTVLASRIMESSGMGDHPFFVNLTAGTTVFSAYDPIFECIKVIRECETVLGHRIWVHVDGSYGGPAVFSETLKDELMGGCEDLDSISISPHKILGVPQQCSVLLVNGNRWDKRTLWKAHGLGSQYLFHNVPKDDAALMQQVPACVDNESEMVEDGEEDGGFLYDIGDATLGCGRRADSLKLFLSWAFHGTQGWRERVERAFYNCQLLADLLITASISVTPDTPGIRFQLVLPESLLKHSPTGYQRNRLSVSFWCIPPGNDEVEDVREFVRDGGEEAFKMVEGWTLKVHAELTRRGRFMVDYMGAGKPEKIPKFMRVAISSPRVDEALLRELMSELMLIRW